MEAVSTSVARGRARSRSRLGAAVLAVLLAATSLALVSVSPTPAGAAPPAKPDSLGKEFWLGFLANESIQPLTLTLFLTGPTATTGTVEIPGLAFSQAFSVTPGSVSTVALPEAAMATGTGISNVAVHVTAAEEITVYGLNRRRATTDAFLGLPVDILGTEYISLGWTYGPPGIPEELGVVATADDTVVTVTPVGGSATSVTIDRGQVYQRQGDGLDGASVTASKPVALFGGHQCARIPFEGTNFCDHVVEQIPPTSTWGKSFVTVPLANRTISDTFNVVAAEDDTELSIDGVVVATLDRGQVHTTQLSVSSGHTITADKPVLVGQYSNGSEFDDVQSDPFFMLVPPFEQFLGDYTITTPAAGFVENFINVVAPIGSVGSITLDGVVIPAGLFVGIGTSGFAGAQLPVSLGSHTLHGDVAFGVFAYGFDMNDSYGYPGGLSLAPVAQVTNLTLTPATATKVVGTQHCVTGHVSDQDSTPLEGVRVDFAVTGANPNSGFANTDAAGNAPYCYTGTTAGSDAIAATTGSLAASAAATWNPVVVPTGTTRCAVNPKNLPLPGQQMITVRTLAGLASITNVTATGGTISVPAFTPGTTAPVIVTTTRAVPSTPVTWSFDATDSNGYVKHCTS